MGLFGLRLPKKVDDVISAVGNGLRPFDDKGWSSGPTNQQRAAGSIQNAAQQVQNTPSPRGVLGTQQGQQDFQRDMGHIPSLNPIKAGAGILYDSTLKPVENTATGFIAEPARAITAQLTGNQEALAAATARKERNIENSVPGMIAQPFGYLINQDIVRPALNTKAIATGDQQLEQNTSLMNERELNPKQWAGNSAQALLTVLGPGMGKSIAGTTGQVADPLIASYVKNPVVQNLTKRTVTGLAEMPLGATFGAASAAGSSPDASVSDIVKGGVQGATLAALTGAVASSGKVTRPEDVATQYLMNKGAVLSEAEAKRAAGMEAIDRAKTSALGDKAYRESLDAVIAPDHQLPAPTQNFVIQSAEDSRIAKGTELLAKEYQKDSDRLSKAFASSPKRMQAEFDKLDATYQARHDNLMQGVGEFAVQLPKQTQKNEKKVTVRAPEPASVVRVAAQTEAPRPQVTVSPAVTEPISVSDSRASRAVRDFKKTQVNQYQLLDDQLKTIDRELGTGGRPLSRQDEFFYDRKMVQGSNAVANRVMQTSDNVKGAFGGLNRSGYKEFSDYANARSELASATDGRPTSRPLPDLQAIVSGASPEMQARFEALNSHYKDMADILYQSGVIDKARYDSFVKNNDYVRLQRDMGDLLPDSFGQGQSFSLGSTISSQRRQGSSRRTLDAGEVAADYTQKVFREATKNRAATHLADAMVEGGVAQKLDNAAAARHENVVTLFRNGEKEYYSVPAGVKEVINNLSPEHADIVSRIVSIPGRVLRAGATGLNPVFIARNLFKDQVTSAINSEHAARTNLDPVNFGNSIFQAMRETVGAGHSDMYEQFLRHYGDQTSYDFTHNAKNANQVVKGIRVGKRESAKQAVIHPLKSLETVAGLTERSTRFQQFSGEYKAAIKAGLPHDVAMQKAAIAAWRNTVDFGTAGTWGRVINTVIPYWNPGVQGSAQLARTFAKHPASSAFKGVALIGIPLATATAWNTLDPERKKIYDNIPEYEKDNNLIMIPPGTKQNEDGSYDVMKIPLAPGFKDVFMPFRRAMESYSGSNPEGYKVIARDMLNAVTGPVNLDSKSQIAGSFIPQAAKPLVNQAMNRDLFTGRPVVPDFMNEATDAEGQPIPEEKKAYKKQSATTQLIADKLHISPVRVEKFIKDTGGQVSMNLLNAADNALVRVGKASPDNVGGQSLAGGFKRSFGSAQGIDNANKSEGAKYFENLEKTMKEVGLNGNEKSAWQSLHPSKKNFLGESIYEGDTVYNPAARLDIYNRYPKVFEMDKAMDAQGRAEGKAGNPLFDLTSNQVKKVLEKENLPPGAKDPELSQLYSQPWFQDYKNAKTNFFNAIRKQQETDLASAEASGDTKKANSLRQSMDKFSNPKNPYPETPEDVQKAMDYYSSLPQGTGARSSFIKGNPDVWKKMTDQWAAVDNWQNKARGERGLAATEGQEGIDNGFKTASKSYGSGSKNYRALKSEDYLKTYSLSKGGSAPKAAKPVTVSKVAVKPRSSGGGKVSVKSSKIRLA